MQKLRKKIFKLLKLEKLDHYEKQQIFEEGSKKDQMVLVKFKSQLTALTKNKILGKVHKLIMSYKNWTIQRPQYKTNGWRLIFQQIQQALCICLRINESQNLTLLNQIAYPKFTYLKGLKLKSNRIQNFQALCFLHIQMIEEINLEKNEITNLSPMKKLNFPKLSIIKFLQNPINTSFEIHRIKCNQDFLYLDLPTNSIDCHRYQFETFRLFPKIASKAIFFKINKNSSQIKNGWVCMYLFPYLSHDGDPFWFTPYERL